MASLTNNNNTRFSVFSRSEFTQRFKVRTLLGGFFFAAVTTFATSTLANDTQSLRQAIDALNLENQQLRDTKALLEAQLTQQEALLEKNARRIHTVKNAIAVILGTPTESFTHDAKALRAKAAQ